MSEWTERMRRELADIDLLPLEKVRALPECGDYDGGIYFPWLGDQLQYIGKSQQICYRLLLQEQGNIHGGIKRIPFDRHTCLVVHSGRIIENPRDLDATLKRLERAYIAHYEPPYNCLDENPGT